MSSMALIVNSGGMIGAWETQGNVYFGQLANGEGIELTLAPGEPGQSKHPTLASDGEGRLLVAWTEGTGWQRGGTLAWQVFDPKGQPTRVKGRLERGIPMWGLPSAVATREGFILFH